jgi:hypothetical protein
MSLVYVFYRLFFRIKDFFHHWYADGTRAIFHRLVLILEKMDATLAFRVTLKHIFEPLYKDYTVIGRAIGFVFRFFRLAIGLAVYFIFGILFLLFYVFWLLLPPAILALAINPA